MANYLPFNSINADRAVKAEDWAWYFATFIGNGVFPNPSDGLQVMADDGMSVLVQPGFGFINGYAFRNQSEYTLTFDTADGSLPRIDRVVLRWDLTNRQMLLDIKKGTVSGAPVAPELTRTGDVYELALADVSITAGLTTIEQRHITDRRTDEDLCGIVAGVIDQIDFETFAAQFEDFFEAFQEENLANFEEWFEHMKDQLDTDAAGHLQNEIDTLAGSVADVEYSPSTSAYAVNDWLVYENQLYTVIAPIEVGDTLTVGTNIQASSLNESLSHLVQESAFTIEEEDGEFLLYWHGAQNECPYTIEYEDGVYNLYFNYTV